MSKKTKIIQFGHPTLRQVADLVPINQVLGPQVQEVIERLKSSLPEYGVGLAAPQINYRLRMFIAEISKAEWSEEPSTPTICINPEIIHVTENTENADWEGCLSAPGFWGQVTRPDQIKVRYISESGKEVTRSLRGVASRVFQHELDHLDGILFVDRMTDMTTLITDEEFQKLSAKNKQE